MEFALPADDLDALKTALTERDELIASLRFEIAQLKRLIFGRRSERWPAPPDPNQLPLWAEVAEDAPTVSPVQFQTVVVSPAKGKPKRTALPAHLPREIVVLPLSAEERACPECGVGRPVIGYETSERLDYVPATLKVIETRREKCACSICQGQLTTGTGAAAGDRTRHSAAGAAGVSVDGQVPVPPAAVPDRTDLRLARLHRRAHHLV